MVSLCLISYDSSGFCSLGDQHKSHLFRADFVNTPWWVWCPGTRRCFNARGPEWGRSSSQFLRLTFTNTAACKKWLPAWRCSSEWCRAPSSGSIGSSTTYTIWWAARSLCGLRFPCGGGRTRIFKAQCQFIHPCWDWPTWLFLCSSSKLPRRAYLPFRVKFWGCDPLLCCT